MGQSRTVLVAEAPATAPSTVVVVTSAAIISSSSTSSSPATALSHGTVEQWLERLHTFWGAVGIGEVRRRKCGKCAAKLKLSMTIDPEDP